MTHQKVRQISIIFLLLQSAWASIYIYLPVLMNQHNISAYVTSVYVVFGLGLAFGFAVMTRVIEGYVTNQQAVILGYGLTAIAIAILLVIHYLPVVYALAFLSAQGAAIGYSFLLAIFSEAAGAEKQGWVMGVSGAMNAIAWGLVPIIIGFFTTFYVYIPFIMAMSLVALAVVLIMWRS